MSSNVKESEVVLFLLIDQTSAMTLQARAQHAEFIIQARTRSLTDSGQEITNRVRKSVVAGKPAVYTHCTKYLLPGNDMTQGECIELEHEVTQEGFEAAIPFMNTMSVKYRHSFRHGSVKIEIDHMVPRGAKTGSDFLKVDIEGGRKEDIPAYLERLKQLGLRIVRNLTEEGKLAGKNIGGKLMSGPDYNHKA